MRPEIYILRIYRRKRDPPPQIAGRVETPSGKLCAGFVTLAELAEILETPNTHLHRADELNAPQGALAKEYRQKGSG